MGEAIRELCVLSLLFGLVMTAAPEGSVKTLMGILCSVILIYVLIEPFSRIDMDDYALELAKYRQLESQLLSRGEEMRRGLDRLVIEENYEAYIMDKASRLGIELESVDVEMQWSSDGVWVPCAAAMNIRSNGASVQALSEHISLELGIGSERQSWLLLE